MNSKKHIIYYPPPINTFKVENIEVDDIDCYCQGEDDKDFMVIISLKDQKIINKTNYEHWKKYGLKLGY